MHRRPALPPVLAAVLTAAVLVAVPAVVPAVAAARSSGPDPATAAVRAAVGRAVTYGHRHGMRTGVAVLDTRTGRIWAGGAADHRFPSASVVKTMIATRLLLSGRMHGSTARRARAMISRSDNAAAWALYPRVGGDRLLPLLARHYRIADLGARPSMRGVWGSTLVTARGLVRFYAAVRHDRRVWPWLSRAMHAYAQRSSGGEPNAFGLAAAAPGSAVKNGWDTHRDVLHPTDAVINSTGVVGGDRWAVAILAEGAARLYYAGGERVVTAQARRVVRPLLAQPVPAAAVRRTGKQRATVVLDPGHNGGNTTHPGRIGRLVYAGYGQRKACNTTGTATNAGYPEHAFTWDVALRVRRILRAHHVQVIMTRSGDRGVGPCVNRRARIESRAGVDAAVALHADGAPPGGHGFHVCIDDRRPEHASARTVARTRRLDAELRRSLTRSSGLTRSTYIGRHAYYYRHDLAGLNLSTKPTAFLELGNMRNRGDAARQRSASGRQHIAGAVAAGILSYLFG